MSDLMTRAEQMLQHPLRALTVEGELVRDLLASMKDLEAENTRMTAEGAEAFRQFRAHAAAADARVQELEAEREYLAKVATGEVEEAAALGALARLIANQRQRAEAADARRERLSGLVEKLKMMGPGVRLGAALIATSKDDAERERALAALRVEADKISRLADELAAALVGDKAPK